MSTHAGVRGSRSIAVFAALAMLLSMIPVFFAPLPAQATPATDGNPDLIGVECGMTVLMVIDETGSMNDGPTQETDLEAAYTAFTTSLANTASTLGVIEFSSYPETFNQADPSPGSPDSARRVTAGYVDPATVTGYPGGTGNATSTSSYQPGGYTNWQEALWEAQLFSADYGYPDLLILFTDGDPNTVDGSGFGNADPGGNNDRNVAAAAAVPYADSLKANGVHMLGIGLGFDEAASQTRLSNVTGDEQGTIGSIDIVHDDWIVLSDSQDIANALEEVANQLCNTTINITKWIPGSPEASFDDQSGTGTGFVEDSGWEFDVSLSDHQGAEWVNGGAPPGETGGSGTVSFKFSLDVRDDTADAAITETLQNGYGFLGGNCVITPHEGQAGSPTAFTSNGWTVSNVPDLATVDCDVYNQASFLSLNKTVIADDGGNPSESQFTLSATGQSLGDVVSGQGDQGPELVLADDYLLDESGPDGYTSSGWTCGDAEMQGSTVTVPVGSHVICSITNYDTKPTLTLEKDVLYTYGGNASDTDWTLTATNGQDSISGIEGAATVTDAEVPGGTYTLSETALTGHAGNYDLVGWSCTNGDDDGTVTLVSGDDVTCTATNESIPASLTLEKEVAENDFGATASAAEWNLAANGPGSNDFNGNGTAEDTTLPAGDYVLSESGGPDGWQKAGDGEWVCDGGSYDDETDTVTLGIGQSATCSITNEAIQPRITLHKDVQTSNGGDATYLDFLLMAEHDVEEFSIEGYNDAGNNGDASVINAGVLVGSYTLSETAQVFGYTPATNWVCLADEGVFDGSNGLDLGPGQSADCTITNSDNPAKLTVAKNVSNQYGGTLENEDFVLMVDQAQVTHGVQIDVPANTTLQIWEDLTDVEGYHQVGDVTCTIGDGDPFDLSGGNIVLSEGQIASCQIDNVDEPGSITVVKETLPADSELDFGLFVAQGDGPPLNVDSGVALEELSAGQYTVGESHDHEGWIQLDLVCEDSDGVIETDGGSFDLAIGQDVTCTITNAELPTITVVKDAIATGPQDETLFPFSGDLSGDLADGDSITETVEPGVYTTTEGDVASWDLTGITCDEGAVGDVDSATATYVVDYGDHPTCTFRNVEQFQEPDPGTIRIVKEIVSGDSEATFEFTGNPNGTIGHEGVLETTVPVGLQVSSTEILPENWSLIDISCVVDNGTAIFDEDLENATVSAMVTSAGSVLTCTFSNVENEVEASVTVTAEGSCVLDGTEEIGSINVTISTDNGATVVVKDDQGATVGTFTQDGSIPATVGATYQWTATANEADDFVFPPGFASAGEVTVPHCSVPFTGIDADVLALLAGGLLLAGLTVVLSTRRRREDGLNR